MLKVASSDSEDIQAPLGEALRKRRKELKLSMQVVADDAGLSVGFISQVERGLTAPSLGSLSSIARVLGLRMGDILEQQQEGTETTFQAARQPFKVPGAERAYERVSTAFEASRLHSVIIHEPPGDRLEPISHEGEEIIFVLSGAVTMEIDGNVEVLNQGDSVHFDSRRTHRTWNHTDQVASLLWCGTMDVFGDEPDPIHKNPPKGGREKPTEEDHS